MNVASCASVSTRHVLQALHIGSLTLIFRGISLTSYLPVLDMNRFVCVTVAMSVSLSFRSLCSPWL